MTKLVFQVKEMESILPRLMKKMNCKKNSLVANFTKVNWFTFILVFAVLGVTCQAPTQKKKIMARNDADQPVIRVGVLQGRAQVDFRVEGKVSFVNRDADFVLRGLPGGRWKIEAIDSKPAEYVYQLAVGTRKGRWQAEEVLRSVRNKGLDAHISKIETNNLSIPYVHKSVYQIVLDKKFSSGNDAKTYQSEIQEKTNSEIIKIPQNDSEGTLRFTNLDNNYNFDSPGPIRLRTSQIQLADVEVGSGFHWETTEHRAYGGTFEFLLDQDGMITAINELFLEDYLKGVVPSEMPAGFPYESLKAQAIAARVEAVSKIGLRHPFEPFDLCDEVHCQVFSGLSHNAERSDMAVESTRGIFMIHRNKITEAFYAGVCGGHTENNENVWLINAKGYLRGVLDRDGNRLSTPLSEESNVKKWIDSNPDVYCSSTRKNRPTSVNYSKKYFRWQVEYKRQELEKIIREKTGEDFGELVDLVPLKRGVSGRLIDLQVVGTKKRFIINRELPIRRALSNKTLYSACFYIKKRGRTKGLTHTYILKGAGWGHGVGMCQVGAAVMAHAGKKFDQILTHYYQGIFLQKLYN